MPQQLVEAPLLDILEDTEALDQVVSLLERELDAFLDDGPIREFPVVGTVLKMIRGGARLSSFLLARKIAGFMRPLKQIPEDERTRLLNRLQADRSYRAKVGEHLLVLIERLDDLGKPRLLAEVFKAFLRNDIDFERFKEIAASIDRCLLTDLDRLRTAPPGASSSWPPAVATRLSSCGLLELENLPSVRAEGRHLNRYRKTDLADDLERHVLTPILAPSS